MKAIYLLGLIAGAVLLFATEAETAAPNITGLTLCVASSYKLVLFTSIKILNHGSSSNVGRGRSPSERYAT